MKIGIPTAIQYASTWARATVLCAALLSAQIAVANEHPNFLLILTDDK